MTEELDDVAARALCSIILAATADVIRDGGADAANALQTLADDTGLVLDVAAGLMQATAWLAAAGDLTAEEVFAASVAMEPDEDEELDDDTTATPGVTHEAEPSTDPTTAPQAPADWPMTDKVVGNVPKKLRGAAGAKSKGNGADVAKAADRDTEQWSPLPSGDFGKPCVFCTCGAVSLTFGKPTCGYHMDHGELSPPCPNCAPAAAVTP